MIIPSHKISAYFQGMSFPFPVLHAKGDSVALIVTQSELLSLINSESVIAVGSWKRIRHLRLNQRTRVNPESAPDQSFKTKNLLIAEDSSTVMRKGMTFSHHMARCNAYGPDGRNRTLAGNPEYASAR